MLSTPREVVIDPVETMHYTQIVGMLPNLTRKRLANIPLSETCKSIVLGTILGDGSLKIQKGYKNARLTIKHSIIQQSYFN